MDFTIVEQNRLSKNAFKNRLTQNAFVIAEEREPEIDDIYLLECFLL